MWHMYHGNYVGMHFVWWLIWVVLLSWIFLIPWILLSQKKKSEFPLEILKRRYAKGEINTKEFEERKSVLEKEISILNLDK